MNGRGAAHGFPGKRNEGICSGGTATLLSCDIWQKAEEQPFVHTVTKVAQLPRVCSELVAQGALERPGPHEGQGAPRRPLASLSKTGYSVWEMRMGGKATQEGQERPSWDSRAD